MLHLTSRFGSGILRTTSSADRGVQAVTRLCEGTLRDQDVCAHVFMHVFMRLGGEASISDTIRRADEALYRGKQSGRNQVCVE